MLEKYLYGKTQNAYKSFNRMIWNPLSKATHVGLDVLPVGVYDTISHFNNDEKAVLDIMKLLQIDRGYYMTKSFKCFNMRRKLSSIYKMSEPQKCRNHILC